MKAIHILNYLNYFFVTTPIVLVATGFLFEAIGNNTYDEILLFGFMGPMATGAFQVICGIFLFVQNPKDTPIHWYLGLVCLYFIGNYIIYYFEAYSSFYVFMIGLPLALCIYFSIILYQKSRS